MLTMTTTMTTLTLTLLAAATLFGRTEALLRLSLDGDSWTATNGNGSITVPARVPGGIYSDLRAAGVLPEDIYYRFNDAEYRWVSYENWNYSTTFQVSSDIKNKRNITLLFNGVDTIADIYLNGNYIGSTENMFVRYFFPVQDYVQEGENTLEVRFQSAVTSALDRFMAEDYIVPPECVPDEYHGECHVNFLRKTQISFSWDWSPAFPSVSIWKNVELLASNNGFIKNYYVSVLFNETSQMYQVTQKVEISPYDAMCDSLTLGVSSFPEGTNKNQAKMMKITSDQLVDPQFEVTWNYAEEDVSKWWPNGLGEQYQYRTFVECLDEDGSYTIEKNIGYRSVNIVQEPVVSEAENGLSFYLEINGIPVFAKGSNWVPSHVLAEMSSDPDRIRNLLTAAKNANMNMLRIWGGGMYESDLFYQIADELGIMIWHDFMFASSMYPTNPSFLDNVAAEISEQVKRLMNHPSVVVWSGNNENELALRENRFGTGSNFSLYYSDYVTLYVDTIGQIVESLDTTRPFVFSSPSNGLKTIEEGYVSQTPSDPLYGDAHNFNDVVNDGWNYTSFPIPRFCSEYGYQSLPSIHTLSSIAIPSDLSAGSDLMQRRQHYLNGYDEMAQQINRHLPLPEDYDTEENFRTFIYFSQINQAMSSKVQTEHYRRNRNKLTDAGEGYTMGALYWQLNDIWEAPSWSSIDFHGNWKMLHYYAKNFFANILVSPYITPEDLLVVSLISDQTYEINSVFLNIYVYRWDSFEYELAITEAHSLPALTAYDAFNSTIESILNETSCSADGDTKDACLLYFTLQDEDGAKISPDNFVFLGEINSAIGISDPSLNITSVTGPSDVTDGNTYTYSIVVSSDSIAPFVWLEAQDITGYFSDNGFLAIQPITEVEFYTSQLITAEELESALSVTSVMSSFH